MGRATRGMGRARVTRMGLAAPGKAACRRPAGGTVLEAWLAGLTAHPAGEHGHSRRRAKRSRGRCQALQQLRIRAPHQVLEGEGARHARWYDPRVATGNEGELALAVDAPHDARLEASPPQGDVVEMPHVVIVDDLERAHAATARTVLGHDAALLLPGLGAEEDEHAHRVLLPPPPNSWRSGDTLRISPT